MMNSMHSMYAAVVYASVYVCFSCISVFSLMSVQRHALPWEPSFAGGAFFLS